jgi:beta-galactosidase
MLPNIAYGGDYNPEQWPPETWEEDARLMKEAGVNLVTLAVFSWGRLEPSAGQYDFTWLDRVIELLYSHGVMIDLATSTASPPPWLVRQHPEVLPVGEDGQKLWYGGRRHYCPHSRAYREAATLLVSALAEHYKNNPAIRLWHVDNEYACGFSECFCDASVEVFRKWLQERYSSLEKLNAAWGTDFWSQQYYSWEEIQPPRRTPASNNPGQKLDWQRFCSDSWRICFEDQKTVLRALTRNMPITTNFMSFFRPLDYWKFAAAEDIVSLDSYPDTSQPGWMVESAMGYDMTRSLGKGEPWLLMEQAPTHVNWRQRNTTKRPGIMRMGSYQALARGADGIMFFQWRASRAGSEKFHSAMLPHSGTETRVWREISQLGEELRDLSELASSRVHADTAVLLDWENWWALEQEGKLAADFRLLPRIRALYTELFRRNITVDFVHPEADLSLYNLVIAPHLYLVSDRSIRNIEAYVEAGGTLLMTFLSGIVDPNDRLRPGKLPAAFSHLLGLWIEEFIAYAQNEKNAVETVDGDSYPCALWSDILHPTDAVVLGQYFGDFFAGSPAITRNNFGKGIAYYLGTELEQPGLSWLMDQVCSDAGVAPVLAVPDGVEVTARKTKKRTWLFLLNHAYETVNIRVPAHFENLMDGRLEETILRLAPNQVAILRQSSRVK